MKLQRKTLEVFTMSFLDVISCAFGAIVMLVLLAKNGDEAEHRDVADMAELLRSIVQVETQNRQLAGELDETTESLEQLKAKSKRADTEQQSLESTLARSKNDVEQLTDKAEGLALVKKSQNRAATRVNTAKKRDEAVGGIPVDSEYVIFIIDTSGSMKSVWSRLLIEMDRILDIHPKVKGFQVMDDMGGYLMKANRGGWIIDTPGSRRRVMKAMRGWYSHSNSSPVEGLEVALKTYAKSKISLAIYILGDDYSGGSYDPVFNSLDRLNTNGANGKRIARVHGVGFISGAGLARFSTLMREVARQNRGTFLALPQ